MLNRDKKSQNISYQERINQMNSDVQKIQPKSIIDNDSIYNDEQANYGTIPPKQKTLVKSNIQSKDEIDDDNTYEEVNYGNIPQKPKVLIKNNIQPTINQKNKPKFN